MYFPFTNTKQLVQDILALSRNPDDLVFVALPEKHTSEIQRLATDLEEHHIPACGGVFPAVIHGLETCSGGVIVKTYRGICAPAIADTSRDQLEWISPLPESLRQKSPALALILFDYTSTLNTTLADELFNRYANVPNYIGAGVTVGHADSEYNLFSRGKIYKKAAMVLFAASRTNVSSRHGWERFKGPHITSSTEGVYLRELNWEPALDIYRAAISEETIDISNEQLMSDIAPLYPILIRTEQEEDLVRDIIGICSHNNLRFPCHIPENTQLFIGHGNQEQLIRATAQAAMDLKNRDSSAITDLFVLQCDSRNNFLADRLKDELQTMSDAGLDGNCAIEGVTACGEICSEGEHVLQVLNKTIVMAATYG